MNITTGPTISHAGSVKDKTPATEDPVFHGLTNMDTVNNKTLTTQDQIFHSHTDPLNVIILQDKTRSYKQNRPTDHHNAAGTVQMTLKRSRQ